MIKNIPRELNFKPLPLLSSKHSQTILGSIGLPLIMPSFQKQMIRLEDGSQLCCIAFIPPEWKESKGIVILLHGMGGSDQSHYMKRITSKLYRLGYFVFCLNRRGCGCGLGLSPTLSHAGKTDDILFVLKKIRKSYPSTPIQMVGFSSGGNLLLKLLGELKEEGIKYLSHCVAVSPLLDLKKTSENFGKPSNRLYEKFYIKGLIKLVRAAESAFPNEEKVQFPKNCSMLQYDKLYTLSKWGYQNIDDYYTKCSSAFFVSDIQTPCDLLYAEDDPLINYENIQSLPFSNFLKLYKTKHGGHMGFLGCTNHGISIRWMDQQVISWLVSENHTNLNFS